MGNPLPNSICKYFPLFLFKIILNVHKKNLATVVGLIKDPLLYINYFLNIQNKILVTAVGFINYPLPDSAFLFLSIIFITKNF